MVDVKEIVFQSGYVVLTRGRDGKIKSPQFVEDTKPQSWQLVEFAGLNKDITCSRLSIAYHNLMGTQDPLNAFEIDPNVHWTERLPANTTFHRVFTHACAIDSSQNIRFNQLGNIIRGIKSASNYDILPYDDLCNGTAIAKYDIGAQALITALENHIPEEIQTLRKLSRKGFTGTNYQNFVGFASYQSDTSLEEIDETSHVREIINETFTNPDYVHNKAKPELCLYQTSPKIVIERLAYDLQDKRIMDTKPHIFTNPVDAALAFGKAFESFDLQRRSGKDEQTADNLKHRFTAALHHVMEKDEILPGQLNRELLRGEVSAISDINARGSTRNLFRPELGC